MLELKSCSNQVLTEATLSVLCHSLLGELVAQVLDAKVISTDYFSADAVVKRPSNV